MLSDASVGAAGSTSGAKPGAAGTTGSTAGSASSTTGAKSTYMLEGGTNLAQNVNKRVEVTGRIMPASSSSSSATSSTGSASSSATSQQHLQVSSVRALGDCEK